MVRRRKNNRKAKNYTMLYTFMAVILTVFYATFAQPLAHKLETILPEDSSGWWWPWWPGGDDRPGGGHDNNKEWDVGFVNVEKTSSYGSAYEVASPTFNKLTASFDVAFVNPGDTITYKFTIKNLGMINAKINNIITTVSNGGDDYIDFKVQGIHVGDGLNVGRTKDVYITSSFKDGTYNNIPNGVKKTLNVTIEYVQK